MRGKSRYTPTNAVQQEPMKSTGRVKTFRLVSVGEGHRSRTITRTKSSSLLSRSSPQSPRPGRRMISVALSSAARFRTLSCGNIPPHLFSQCRSRRLRTTEDRRCWPFGWSHFESWRRMLAHCQDRQNCGANRLHVGPGLCHDAGFNLSPRHTPN